jgi:hypothetical protein
MQWPDVEADDQAQDRCHHHRLHHPEEQRQHDRPQEQGDQDAAHFRQREVAEARVAAALDAPPLRRLSG